MSFSLDVLNKIRETASTEYQARIPEATRNNISTIGNALASYTPLFNEFCDALINRIGLTLLEQATFENPLKHFKMGQLTTGQDVQEIFVSMAQAEGMYDPQGKNPLGRRTPAEVQTIYHRMNRQDKYVISLGEADFARNFTSEATLDAFIAAQLNSIYTADEFDEYELMKNLLGTYTFDGKSYFDYEVPTITGSNNAAACKSFVKTLKKAVQDMTFMSNKYNAAGVKRRAKAGDFVLFIHKDMLPEIDVEVLMGAFNADKANIKPTIVPVDDFGPMTGCYALLVENGFLRVWDVKLQAEQIRNPDGLFNNHFFHHWQIMSLSPFKNAVRFKSKASS